MKDRHIALLSAVAFYVWLCGKFYQDDNAFALFTCIALPAVVAFMLLILWTEGVRTRI